MSAAKVNQTILIVEDDALNMRLFQDLLAARGYHTIACRDGARALSLAIAHRPDLVIMDIQLNGTSGIDLTQSLKADERTARIPVLAVTAFAMRNDEQRIRAAGCDGYLPKPIQVDSFLDAVAALALEAVLA